jgi:hypothetical protein
MGVIDRSGKLAYGFVSRHPYVLYADLTVGTDGISESVRLDGYVPIGLQVGTDWGSDALTVTFQGSIKSTASSDFFSMYDSVAGSEISAILVDSTDIYRHSVLPAASFYGLNYIKVRSGVAATPVAQSSDLANIRLVYRKIE